VHLDGAGYEALTYRVSFGEADSDGRQTLQLHALTGDDAREDAASGSLVLEGRTGEPASQGGTRIWAGRIGDPFYIDLDLLSTVNGAVKAGTAPYVIGTPASYGFAGRNGRTLADNAPEAMLSLITNTGVNSGLTAATSERLRTESFPYVVPA
jgi:hypothetical protein